MTASEIRAKLREALAQRRITQAELCARLTKLTGDPWHQQHMSKLLNGANTLTVEQLVLMADAAGLSLVELVREPGREFVADLTPSELLVLHAIRDTPQLQPAILQLLGPSLRQLPGASRHAIIKARMARQTKGGDD